MFPPSYNASIASISQSEMYGKFVSIVGNIKSSGAVECAKPNACPISCLATVSSAVSERVSTANIVILIASTGTDDVLEQLKEKGFREVLKKPLQLDTLVSTLEAISKS